MGRLATSLSRLDAPSKLYVTPKKGISSGTGRLHTPLKPWSGSLRGSALRTRPKHAVVAAEVVTDISHNLRIRYADVQVEPVARKSRCRLKLRAKAVATPASILPPLIVLPQ